MERSVMLDKVVGHYAVVGTEEATEFLRLCDQLGLKWFSGQPIYWYTPHHPYICVYISVKPFLSEQDEITMAVYGVKLKPFIISTPQVGMIDVPFGAEYYISTFFGVQTWFKKSDGVILECKAPKTPSTPQYPFWEVEYLSFIESPWRFIW